jgi:hypothetical protein
MKLIPRNKRYLLQKVNLEGKGADSSLEEFASAFAKKPKIPTNEVYRVLDFSNDCTLVLNYGTLVIVEGNMVEETKVGETTFVTAKENFILGTLDDA